MTNDSGIHLNTSRISRLLRPLRTKCTSLAANINDKPHGTVTITYASSSRSASRRTESEVDPLPLSLILPLGRLTSLSRSSRPSLDDYQLSKVIYDIRDAYRNVVHVAFGASSSLRGDALPDIAPQSAVRSLASICASVLGEHIEDQACIDDEEEAAHNEEVMEVLHELYEAVPAHFRRYTVVAHALHLILATCPPHPSLLHLLLESSLSYSLVPESRLLLRHLLEVAFHPPGSSSPSPRVAHPAHAGFLTMLRDLCCKTLGNATAVFNDRQFARVVVNTLTSEPEATSVEAWTCKAISRLARRLLKNDFLAFMLLPAALLPQVFRHKHGGASRERRTSKIQAPPDDRLLERLTKWLEAACRHVHLASQGHGVPMDEMKALANLLMDARQRDLTLPVKNSEPSPIDLFICLSAVSLSSPSFQLLGDDEQGLIIKFALGTRPNTTTFSTLIALAVPSDCESPEDHSISSPHMSFSAALPSIRHWANSLRSYKCSLHEASLWSATLSHLEDLYSETSGLQLYASTREFEALRAEIIDLVEKAERRSFGECVLSDGALSACTPRKDLKDPGRGEWRLDEMFGCWVMKTPAPPVKTSGGHVLKRPSAITGTHAPSKRRRTHIGIREQCVSPAHSRTAFGDSYSIGRRRPRAPSLHSSRTSASLSPAPSYEATPSFVSAISPELSDDDGEEDENVPPSPTRVIERPARSKGSICKTFPSRRASGSFQTIVADALKNRIVLHPRRSQNRSGTEGWPLPDEPSQDDIQDSYAANICTADQLSSDDALNLFAYGSSEA